MKKQKGYYALDQQLKLEYSEKPREGNKIYLKSIKKRQPIWEKLEITVEKTNMAYLNNKISYFKISNAPIVDSDLFFDKGHLKSKGARAFTQAVAKSDKMQIEKSAIDHR